MIEYKISYNATGGVLETKTSETAFALDGVAPGVYIFTVLAINIIGDGEKDNITVTGLLVNICDKHVRT